MTPKPAISIAGNKPIQPIADGFRNQAGNLKQAPGTAKHWQKAQIATAHAPAMSVFDEQIGGVNINQRTPPEQSPQCPSNTKSGRLSSNTGTLGSSRQEKASEE